MLRRRHGAMTSLARLAAALAAVLLAGGAAPSAPAKTLIPIASGKPGDTLAVLYSGDGGWGPLDQQVAQRLADNGMPTIGVNSLAYFSVRRSPDAVAGDLAASLHRYEALWGRRNVVLVGYSFGADALPAIVPRLAPDVRASVSRLVLIGTGPHGDLRFHPASWLNLASGDSFPVAPAIGALRGMKITCIYGDGERRDICPALPDDEVAKVRLPGGHHFNGDYAALGAAVLRASR